MLHETYAIGQMDPGGGVHKASLREVCTPCTAICVLHANVLLEIQSNPLNGSPDNGSIRFIVQDFAGPILQCSLSESQ